MTYSPMTGAEVDKFIANKRKNEHNLRIYLNYFEEIHDGRRFSSDNVTELGKLKLKKTTNPQDQAGIGSVFLEGSTKGWAKKVTTGVHRSKSPRRKSSDLPEWEGTEKGAIVTFPLLLRLREIVNGD